MTPNDLEVLIHCHVSPEPHPRYDAGAVRQTLQYYLTSGIISVTRRDSGDVCASVFQTTEKGRKWLTMILDTPEPVQVWADPRERRDEA